MRLLMLAAALVAMAPVDSPAVKFDSSRAWEHLRRQVSFGPATVRVRGAERVSSIHPRAAQGGRHRGATAGLHGAHAARRDDDGQHHRHDPGGAAASASSSPVHFDTKRAPDFRFVGASDGASSTATLLELGRALKGRQNEFTIELLFLDGEEAVNWEWRDPDNTYGSRHYVQTAKQSAAVSSIKAFVLLDMVGDRNLTLRRDANSTPWLVEVIWNAAGRLGQRAVFSNELTTIEDDPQAVSARGRAVRGSDRSRLPAVAHGTGRPRSRQRTQSAGRRRRRPRIAADIEAAWQRRRSLEPVKRRLRRTSDLPRRTPRISGGFTL
jgi:hypothetical protein